MVRVNVCAQVYESMCACVVSICSCVRVCSHVHARMCVEATKERGPWNWGSCLRPAPAVAPRTNPEQRAPVLGGCSCSWWSSASPLSVPCQQPADMGLAAWAPVRKLSLLPLGSGCGWPAGMGQAHLARVVGRSGISGWCRVSGGVGGGVRLALLRVRDGSLHLLPGLLLLCPSCGGRGQPGQSGFGAYLGVGAR